MPKSDDQSEGLGRISNMFNRDGGSEPPVGIYVPQTMYDDFVKICARSSGSVQITRSR